MIAEFCGRQLYVGYVTFMDESEQQRTERYLQMATDTAAQAQRTGDPAVAEAYMHLASVWLKLAGEVGARTPANDERDDEPDGSEERAGA